MRQIRARIREKRGADYTEAELQELATTNLQKFLDPKGVRSDLVEQFRKGHRPSEWPNYEFGETTLYDSHRGFIRGMRKLLRPVLKLFFNPDPIVAALHVQSQLNTELLRQQERESLRYELVHNLVVELTRASIEVQNLKMRVESLSSRMDFDERRARSLEQVVQYKKPAPRPAAPQAQAAAQPPAPGAGTSGPAGAMVANLTHPLIHGTAFATLTLANNLLGLAPGPFVTGLVADRIGLAGALEWLPLVSLGAIAAFLAAYRVYHRDLERIEALRR